MRAVAIILLALLLVTGCGTPGVVPDAAIPRNEGGNADLHGIYVRNAYLAGGSLFAVLINGGTRADRLDAVKVGNAVVTLGAQVDLLPNAPLGAGQPLGNVGGVSGEVGSWIAATFEFRDAGSVTAQIPIKDRSG